MNQLEKLIGENFYSNDSMAANWLEYWPLVDDSGDIIGIVDADSLEGYELLEDRNGILIPTDGENGFDAVR
jgi:hypothetical protein